MGEYRIKIDYYYSPLWYSKQAYLNLTVIGNFFAPYFTPSLASEKVFVPQNTSLTYILPSIIDLDMD